MACVAVASIPIILVFREKHYQNLKPPLDGRCPTNWWRETPLLLLISAELAKAVSILNLSNLVTPKFLPSEMLWFRGRAQVELAGLPPSPAVKPSVHTIQSGMSKTIRCAGPRA